MTNTRQQLLDAALQRFAQQGYAGTSIQEIVDAAQVTKPALYYHFRNKADLYRALVDWALDERYRLIREAAAGGASLAEQLTAIGAASFGFVQRHRDLTRLAYATMFAAPGEVPVEAQCFKKGWRNFEFIHELLQTAVRTGKLAGGLNTRELAMAFVGMLNLHVMAYLVEPKRRLSRGVAERIVKLFLAGAQSICCAGDQCTKS